MEDEKSKIDDECLVLLKLGEDEDLFLNRLDSIIEYVSGHQTDDEEDFFTTPLVLKLIEVRMFYLAWSEGGY